MTYENSHERGVFETSWDPLNRDTPVQYQVNGEVSIDLECSPGYQYFFFLDHQLALGCSYGWRSFVDSEAYAHYSPGPEPSQMAVWNYRSGKRVSILEGLHFGVIEGACLDNAGGLLTWGEDYCLKKWDLRSGKELQTRPLPLFTDEKNRARISRKSFSPWPLEDKVSYLTRFDSPAPNVTIVWKLTPGSPPTVTSIEGQTENPGALKPWIPSTDIRNSHLQNLSEQGGVEAGYSTAFLLDDGRLVSAGTTYGANGLIYVWDGSFELTLLFAGYSYGNFNLDKGTSPNSLDYWEDIGEGERGRVFSFQV